MEYMSIAFRQVQLKPEIFPIFPKKLLTRMRIEPAWVDGGSLKK